MTVAGSRLDHGYRAVLHHGADQPGAPAGNQANGMSAGLLDRLKLTAQRIHSMAEGLLQIAELEDPVGRLFACKSLLQFPRYTAVVFSGLKHHRRKLRAYAQIVGPVISLLQIGKLVSRRNRALHHIRPVIGRPEIGSDRTVKINKISIQPTAAVCYNNGKYDI